MGKPVSERNFPMRQRYRVKKSFYAIGRMYNEGEIMPPGKRGPFIMRMLRRGLIEKYDEPPVVDNPPVEVVKPISKPNKKGGIKAKKKKVVKKKMKRVVKDESYIGTPKKKRGRPRKKVVE